MKVIYGGSGEALSGSIGGRVIEVNVYEGKAVRHGDVLIRLETERLENEMAKRQHALQAGEQELAKLDSLGTLLADQFASTKAKAEAELTQAREEIHQATDRQAADIRLAELALHNMQYEEAQVRQQVACGLIARDELRKATGRLREAQERFDTARLPVVLGKVEVLRRALTLAEHALGRLDERVEPRRVAVLLERLGRYAWASGREADALSYSRRAVDLVPEQPPSAERARALAGHAHILMAEWHDRAASVARR